MLYYLSPVVRKARLFLFVLLLFFSQYTKAGIPGNTPDSSITVRFSNIKSLGNFVLHIKDNETDIIIYNDTLYMSSGISGMIEVFAELDGVKTESTFLNGHPQHNYEVEFKGVSGKDLLYDLKQPAATADSEAAATRKFADSRLIRFWKTNELLVGVSFVVLISMIIYFVWRKKKKSLENIDTAL